MTVENLVNGVARFFSWLHDDWEWLRWVLLATALAVLVMAMARAVRHLIKRNIMRGGEEKYWRTM